MTRNQHCEAYRQQRQQQQRQQRRQRQQQPQQPQQLSFVSLASLRCLIMMSHPICSPLPATQDWTALHGLRWLTVRSPKAELPAQLQHSLGRFQQLRHLELDCSDVRLPDLVGLSHLTALVLSGCGCITQLPAGISALTAMAGLDCSRRACTPCRPMSALCMASRLRRYALSLATSSDSQPVTLKSTYLQVWLPMPPVRGHQCSPRHDCAGSRQLPQS